MNSSSNETNNEVMPKIEIFPTWEILAALMGYVASVDPAIEFVGHHIFNHKKGGIPHSIRIWTSVGYFIFMLFVAFWTLWRSSKGRQPKETSSSDRFLKA